jgi:hypothetical protein
MKPLRGLRLKNLLLTIIVGTAPRFIKAKTKIFTIIAGGVSAIIETDSNHNNKSRRRFTNNRKEGQSE